MLLLFYQGLIDQVRIERREAKALGARILHQIRADGSVYHQAQALAASLYATTDTEE